MSEKLTIGFLPLVDACLPILARELGFAEEEGLDLALTRDVTWATVLELTGVGAMLAIGIYRLDLIGAVAASVAMLTGRVIGTVSLVLPCLRVLRSAPLPAPRPAAEAAVAK